MGGAAHGRPGRRPHPGRLHLVLTDRDELRALAADLDRQAADRRAGLVDAGELPDGWPLPYEAADTLESLVARAAERVEEQAGADAGYAAAPPLPGRADRAGRLAGRARRCRSSAWS